MAAKIRKSGLGRDFNSLFEDNYVEKSHGPAEMIRLCDIEPNRAQPRKLFNEEELATLAASISQFGLLQPIVVTENVDYPGTYKIIAGERRWRASNMAGLTEIPAVVFSGDELAQSQIALIENVQRQDLTAIEEALGYRDLIERFGLTQEQVSVNVGKSRSAITNALRLLELPRDVLELVDAGKLSAGHARTLLGIKNSEKITETARFIVENGISVRETEKLVKKLNTPASEKNVAEKDLQKVSYISDLEERSMRLSGHRIKIRDDAKGKRRIEIYYGENEDLEEILVKICGNEIFG